MPSIGDLIGTLQTRTIHLRGKAITVRAVPAARVDLLKRAFPKPVPDLKPNPLKGVNADPELAEWDPAYIRGEQAWFEKITVLQAAMAIDQEGPDHGGCDEPQDEKAMKAWGEHAYAQLMKFLTPAEINRIAEAQKALVLGVMEEEAGKNS